MRFEWPFDKKITLPGEILLTGRAFPCSNHDDPGTKVPKRGPKARKVDA